MPVAARTIITTDCLAQVLVEQPDGRWRVAATLEGPDAPDRAEELRARLEAGDELAGGLPDRRPGWAVRLPDAVRAHFEALAAGWGGTPEEQLVRYLESDRLLRDLAACAAGQAEAAGASA